MSRRKKLNPLVLKKNVEDLMNFIYENELESDFDQYSPYHFRIRGNVDVWPSSKKYYRKGMSGALVYKNLNDLKMIIS